MSQDNASAHEPVFVRGNERDLPAGKPHRHAAVDTI